jgi:hypothetical protein
MPFVQMENVSHFLRAIQSSPLNMPPHDTFLTVDLYEQKDPLQVLQCISAFSRVAHTLNPNRFKRSIGPKGRVVSPQATGESRSSFGTASTRDAPRSSHTFNPVARKSTENPISPTLTGGSNKSNSSTGRPSSIVGGVSSWTKKEDQNNTAPAWNIHQYGYMGGASQGNQGISFGGRRQITTPGPHVPSLADKEKQRREEAAEAERAKVAAEEAEYKRRVERQAEEDRVRAEAERQAAEQARLAREAEKKRIEEEKRRWESEEQRWKEQTPEPNSALTSNATSKPTAGRLSSDTRLNGQYLSEYQAEARKTPLQQTDESQRQREQDRIRELELELEKARAREAEYERERRDRLGETVPSPSPLTPASKKVLDTDRSDRHRRDSEESWRPDEREVLPTSRRREFNDFSSPPAIPARNLPEPIRPIPEAEATPVRVKTNHTGPSARPLPDPAAYSAGQSRTDRYLEQNPAPIQAKAQTHFPNELGMDSEAERYSENSRREESLNKTKAGGWASKSLLEREMERERERQQEWEEEQKATREAASKGVGRGQLEATVGAGGNWDVNQYGYTGGDSQNNGAHGIGFGGRRQIIGPRPPR